MTTEWYWATNDYKWKKSKNQSFPTVDSRRRCNIRQTGFEWSAIFFLATDPLHNSPELWFFFNPFDFILIHENMKNDLNLLLYCWMQFNSIVNHMTHKCNNANRLGLSKKIFLSFYYDLTTEVFIECKLQSRRFNGENQSVLFLGQP